MQQKVVVIAVIVLAGFFLLNSGSLTGFQVFRLFSPGYSQPYPMPGGYWPFQESCSFYGYNHEEVANSCNNCLFDAFDTLEEISRGGRIIEGLRVDPCVTEQEGELYFSRGYISATIR